jgi:cytoskeletal protein CcmA (bactofilin family)
MLKKPKYKQSDIPAESPSVVGEKVVEPSLSPTLSEEKTVIGQNISVEGTVRGEANLFIEGSLKGSVELEKHHVTVGSKGHAEAEINAYNVTVSGRLTGNIKAHGKVEITKDADFRGEIKAKRISIEDGAYLKAVIELERESEKKVMPGSSPTQFASTSPNVSQPLSDKQPKQVNDPPRYS